MSQMLSHAQIPFDSEASVSSSGRPLVDVNILSGLSPVGPVAHRVAVSVVDGSGNGTTGLSADPASPIATAICLPSGAVQTSGKSGYVRFHCWFSAGTGTCTAVVQVVEWDSAASNWAGGAVAYLTNAAVPSSIPSTPQPVSCTATNPGAIEIQARGLPVFLKILGISGTSAALSVNAVVV